MADAPHSKCGGKPCRFDPGLGHFSPGSRNGAGTFAWSLSERSNRCTILPMLIRQAFRFRLEPTLEQAQLMARTAGCCRFVWNRALAMQNELHSDGHRQLSYPELCKRLTVWRNEHETNFLSECPVHTQQQTLKDLGRAFTNFFEGRAALPRFKKKGRAEHFRFPDHRQFKLDLRRRDENGVQQLPRVFLPKIGWVKVRVSRRLEGECRNATVTKQGNRWYISIQTEREVQEPVHSSTSSIGIDLGVKRLATLSDGTVIEPLNRYRHLEAKLSWEQRKLARKTRFSRNWHRQRAKLQRLHAHIANGRSDQLHKVSTSISKNHALVVVEDLVVRRLTEAPKGKSVHPRGKNAKTALNKAILDQGWYSLRRMLDYKLHWQGGRLVVVEPRHTSQRCSNCGLISSQNRKTQAEFKCVGCSHCIHADLNAALNILRAGHALVACASAQP